MSLHRTLLICTIVIFTLSNQINAQQPISEISGLVEIYDNLDTTSLYIGKDVGRFLKNGEVGLFFNTMIGSKVGLANNTGIKNSFFGFSSGTKNSLGSSNSFLGYNSGKNNQTGDGNSFLGAEAGVNNHSGSNNTLLGNRAGSSNYDGNGNTFIGYRTGDNSFGDNNTFIGISAGAQVLGGHRNIIIGNQAGPSILTSFNDRLFIDTDARNDPLIYGEFDNDLVRINGRLEVTEQISFSGNYVVLKNLSDIAQKGILFAEEDIPNFGLLYNGSGTIGNKKMHFREYNDGIVSDILTLQDNGNVGIGTSSPNNKLHIDGGTDASVSDGGFLLIGDQSNLNMIVDDNEIMARNNGDFAPLNLNINGGDVRLGGKIRILDDNTISEKGQIRFNEGTNNFEGYDGTKWLSLTSKPEQQVFIGPASFYSDDASEAQRIKFWNHSGVTRNTNFSSGSKYRFIPLDFPVGTKLSQLVYFFAEDLNDATLEMKLVRFNLTDSNKEEVGFVHETELISQTTGWTSAGAVDDVTIEPFYFYAIQFYNSPSNLTNFQNLLEYKGVRITYVLP